MRKPLSILAAVAMLGIAAPAAADDFNIRLGFGQPVAQAGEVHTIPVNNFLLGRGVMPLRLLARLGPNYDGREVERVVVSLRSPDRGTRLVLLGNGRVRDVARVHSQGRVVLDPGRGGVLGRDLGRLGLQIDGRAYVHDIRIVLAPPRHQWRPYDGRGWGWYGDHDRRHDGRRYYHRAPGRHGPDRNGRGNRDRG